jgi:hypothetical protein
MMRIVWWMLGTWAVSNVLLVLFMARLSASTRTPAPPPPKSMSHTAGN